MKLDEQGEKEYKRLFESFTDVRDNLMLIAGIVQNPYTMNVEDLDNSVEQLESLRGKLLALERQLVREHNRQSSLFENKSDL